MKLVPPGLERVFFAIVDPLIGGLVRVGVRPNTITTIGVGLVIASAVAFGMGSIRLGGLLLLLSGVVDTFDGAVARRTGATSKFGAFYDSTLDRIGDGATFIGIGLYFLTAPEIAYRNVAVVVCMVAILASLVVSYTRARAEGLEGSPKEAGLIVENCAGMGSKIGASFGEIGRLIQAVGSPRMKVCLDTEHCFAAGYNIADPKALDEAMHEFDREIGLERLVAVHANDAKVELGSGVDRHENIGDGHIGTAGFEVLMGHPAFGDVPFLLEVPGFEKDGPDKKNVDILKRIRTKVAGR